MTSARSLVRLAVLAGLLLAPAAAAEAQYVVPGPPIYGSFSVTIGDYTPGMLQGVAGGPVSLSAVDGACRGTATVQPSHVILASGTVSLLRIAVRSGQDSTLMVQLPDGRRLCNDDSNGLDAMIETGTIAGPVYVWVGSYSGGNFPYTLDVTQVGAPPPPSMGAIGPGGIPLDCGMTRAVYGSLRIGDGLVLGAHTPWTGPNGQGGYSSGDANWSSDMSRWVGQRTVITTPTVAVWSPRGGSPVEFATVSRGPVLVISATVGGAVTQLVEIPAALASSAVVTATRRPDGKVLFRAERAPEGMDPGQQMLLLVQWDRASSAPAIAQQWIGSFSERAPGWAR